MGGRGSAGGAIPGIFGKERPITVETTYIEGRGFARGRYKDSVLRAVDKGNGQVELVYATADKFQKTAKTNKTNYVTYTLDHGFVNDQPHNINFEKIKSFSGQTYQVKEELKRRGFKFKNGKWERP